MAEQRAVAVFRHLLLDIWDQPFHNFGMQWHVPGFVPLYRAPRLAIIFTDKKEPLPRYDFLGIAVSHEIEIEGAAINNLRHSATAVGLHQQRQEYVVGLRLCSGSRSCSPDRQNRAGAKSSETPAAPSPSSPWCLQYLENQG